MPIDDFVECGLFRATVRGDLDAVDPVHAEMIETCAKWEPEREVKPLAPADFYQRCARSSYDRADLRARLYGTSSCARA